MKKKRIIVLAVTVVIAAAFAWAWAKYSREEASPYRFATVERGDIRATVAATGALSAVTTVQVGTQVSGRVVEIHADFNDRVKRVS